MSATDSMYAAATAATLDLIQQDVQAAVPAFFRSEINQDELNQYAGAIAKAAVDAALAAQESDNTDAADASLAKATRDDEDENS